MDDSEIMARRFKLKIAKQETKKRKRREKEKFNKLNASLVILRLCPHYDYSPILLSGVTYEPPDAIFPNTIKNQRQFPGQANNKTTKHVEINNGDRQTRVPFTATAVVSCLVSFLRCNLFETDSREAQETHWVWASRVYMYIFLRFCVFLAAFFIHHPRMDTINTACSKRSLVNLRYSRCVFHSWCPKTGKQNSFEPRPNIYYSQVCRAQPRVPRYFARVKSLIIDLTFTIVR